MKNEQQKVFPTIKSDPRWLAASLAILVAVNQVTVMVASQFNLILPNHQVHSCSKSKKVCMPLDGVKSC